MKHLIQRIAKYHPFNEQESMDQSLMLSYVDLFSDVLTRNNKHCHFTSSGFILNETCSKVLMMHHHIFNNYSWIGGHLDGNPDCLEVARQEALKKTGIQTLKVMSSQIMSIDILPVIGHYKNEQYVEPHLHLSIGHLFMASEKSNIPPELAKNKMLQWIPLAELEQLINEPSLLFTYDKIRAKVRLLQEAPF